MKTAKDYLFNIYVMKRLSRLLILTMLSISGAAQNQVTLRQQSFPTDLPAEDENIEWQRDIYREINLMVDENVGLYCPQEPTENQQGLFTEVFNLALEKAIPIYRYNIDGNEVFNDIAKANIKDVLINNHIFYQEEDGHILVDKDDIPATEVMFYFVKEGIYYDVTNSTFRRRVKAICPVLIENDDFTDEPTRYPLFWVRYKDLEPYLKDITIIPNYNNRATVISMADYFTRNLYKGDIYKVSNALGRTLRQMVDSDSALKVVQQHIEKDIRQIRKTTYNTYYKPVPKTKVDNKQETPIRKPKKKPFWKKGEIVNNDSEQ